MTRRSRVGLIVSLVAASLAPSAGRAQADSPAQRPGYELIRFDEDWSGVRDPRLRIEWSPAPL